jgi:hypothetical protein
LSLFSIPDVQIAPGKRLEEAEARLCAAFEEADIEFFGMDRINSGLPCRDHCKFFCSGSEAGLLVSVLSIGDWDENETLNVLNVLLGLRLEPHQPGKKVQVHFFSVLEVPPVLLLISGDTLFSEFEARACLVARFGEDIRPENCQQMAAAGMHLVRSVLNTEVSLLDPGSLDELARVVCDSLEAEELPLSEPLNSMILLGCLFGEMVRNQIELESAWLALHQFEPWPAVVFMPEEKTAETDSVAFSPVAHIGSLLSSRDRGVLRKALEELQSACRQLI